MNNVNIILTKDSYLIRLLELKDTAFLRPKKTINPPGDASIMATSDMSNVWDYVWMFKQLKREDNGWPLHYISLFESLATSERIIQRKRFLKYDQTAKILNELHSKYGGIRLSIDTVLKYCNNILSLNLPEAIIYGRWKALDVTFQYNTIMNNKVDMIHEILSSNRIYNLGVLDNMIADYGLEVSKLLEGVDYVK